MSLTPLISLRMSLAALLLGTAMPREAQAQATAPKKLAIMDSPTARHVVEGQVGSSNFDPVAAELAYRYVFPSRWQFGVRFGTALSRQAYFAGYAADQAVSTEASAQLFVPLLARGPLLL